MIESLSANLEPHIRAVTTILMHSLWQGTLIGLVAAIALSLLRSGSAKIRYAVSCSAMAAVILAVGVTAASVWPGGHGSVRSTPAATIELAGGEGISSVSATINIPAPVNDVSSSNRWWRHPSINRYIFIIWVTGVMLLSVYHLLGWRRARGFARRGTSPVPPEWHTRFEQLCDELRFRRLLSLLSSSLVKVPCVVGWVKPVILVPVSMFTSLSPSDIEMILVHELAHVRRYDVLVNMIQAAMETLFFFNPAIWWLSRQIRIEREDCCDEAAILRTGNRLRYARALANLEELRMFQTSFGSAITGTPLSRRIQRITGATRPRLYSSTLSFSGLLLIIAIIALLVGSSGGLKSSAVQASENSDAAQTFNPEPGNLRGEWEVESDRDEVKILVYGRKSSGMNFALDRDEVEHLIGQGKKSFRIVRDAGTVFLEGTLQKRGRRVEGSGEWYFRPDSAYVHFMSRYGLPENDQQKVFSFAIFDISREFLGELRDAGYADVPYDRLLSMRVQGVTVDDAREFERLGCGHLTPDELISARIHNITPEFVRGFRDAGFADLSYKSFVTLRAFNLDIDDFKDCCRHRFMDMSENNMVWVCGFGITKKDIEKMQERGYTNLDTIIRILAKERGR